MSRSGDVSAEGVRSVVGLDVDAPEPPELPEVDVEAYEDVEVQGEEYRRQQLDVMLAEGAWEDAFESFDFSRTSTARLAGYPDPVSVEVG